MATTSPAIRAARIAMVSGSIFAESSAHLQEGRDDAEPDPHREIAGRDTQRHRKAFVVRSRIGCANDLENGRRRVRQHHRHHRDNPHSRTRAQRTERPRWPHQHRVPRGLWPADACRHRIRHPSRRKFTRLWPRSIVPATPRGVRSVSRLSLARGSASRRCTSPSSSTISIVDGCNASRGTGDRNPCAPRAAPWGLRDGRGAGRA